MVTEATKSNIGVIKTQERSNKVLKYSKGRKMIDVFLIETDNGSIKLSQGRRLFALGLFHGVLAKALFFRITLVLLGERGDHS